jgi:hypothetical protein
MELAGQLDEPGAGDARRDLPGGFDRYERVAPIVQHERRRRDGRKDCADIQGQVGADADRCANDIVERSRSVGSFGAEFMPVAARAPCKHRCGG